MTSTTTVSKVIGDYTFFLKPLALNDWQEASQMEQMEGMKSLLCKTIVKAVDDTGQRTFGTPQEIGTLPVSTILELATEVLTEALGGLDDDSPLMQLLSRLQTGAG